MKKSLQGLIAEVLIGATIKIILDSKTVKTFDMKVTDYPTLISIPLNNALQMRIEYQSDYNTARIGFGNITLE